MDDNRDVDSNGVTSSLSGILQKFTRFILSLWLVLYASSVQRVANLLPVRLLLWVQILVRTYGRIKLLMFISVIGITSRIWWCHIRLFDHLSLV